MEMIIPEAEILFQIIGLEDKIGQNIKFAKGQGCKVCNQSGYKGRIGIYELLKVTPEIQEAVLKKVSADEIRNLAVSQGMTTLRKAALEKLLQGGTTPEEVLRVTLESGG